MKPNLKLAPRDEDDTTRAQIEMERIAQEHRDSKWTPFSEIVKHPILRPDETHSKVDLMLQSMVGKV